MAHFRAEITNNRGFTTSRLGHAYLRGRIQTWGSTANWGLNKPASPHDNDRLTITITPVDWSPYPPKTRTIEIDMKLNIITVDGVTLP